MSEIVLHTLNISEEITLTILSEEIYSSERITVRAGEKYRIVCLPGQTWTDWFIPSSPKGFFNPLAILSGLRLKGTRCFCLCGAYNETEAHLFEIGLSGEADVREGKTSLSFFANDAMKHYDNNSGCIRIVVRRVR